MKLWFFHIGVVTLALSCSTAMAQSVQQRAEFLIDQARHLSDIRASNAPAFRLKATFSFVGSDLETTQGTYTEVWISNRQWYRETTGSDWRRVEVGGPNRVWQMDTGGDIPEAATKVPDMVEAVPSKRAIFEFDSINSNTYQDREAECATTKPDKTQRKGGFCFDKKSGVLIAKMQPEIRPGM